MYYDAIVAAVTSVRSFILKRWYLVLEKGIRSISKSHQRAEGSFGDSEVSSTVSFEKGILGLLAWRQVNANVW